MVGNRQRVAVRSGEQVDRSSGREPVAKRFNAVAVWGVIV